MSFNEKEIDSNTINASLSEQMILALKLISQMLTTGSIALALLALLLGNDSSNDWSFSTEKNFLSSNFSKVLITFIIVLFIAAQLLDVILRRSDEVVPPLEKKNIDAVKDWVNLIAFTLCATLLKHFIDNYIPTTTLKISFWLLFASIIIKLIKLAFKWIHFSCGAGKGDLNAWSMANFYRPISPNEFSLAAQQDVKQSHLPISQLKRSRPLSRREPFEVKRKMTSSSDEEKFQLAIANIFSKFDINQDGYLGLDEVCLMLKAATGQQNLTRKDADNYLKIIDRNSDGQLSLTQFTNAYMNLIQRS